MAEVPDRVEVAFSAVDWLASECLWPLLDCAAPSVMVRPSAAHAAALAARLVLAATPMPLGFSGKRERAKATALAVAGAC